MSVRQPAAAIAALVGALALAALAPGAAAEAPAAEVAAREPAARWWIVPEVGMMSTQGSAGAGHERLVPGLDVDWRLHEHVGLRFATEIIWFEEGTSEVFVRRVHHNAALLGVGRYEVLRGVEVFAGAGLGAATTRITRRALEDSSASFELAPSLAWTAGLDIRAGRFLVRLSGSGAHHRLSRERMFSLGFGIPLAY